MRAIPLILVLLLIPSAVSYGQFLDCYPFNCPTAPGPPLVGTEPASQITESGATLNGFVNPSLSPTMVWFEWSTDSTLSRFEKTPDVSAGAEGNTTLMSSQVNGLAANSDYYFRVAAANGYGTARGLIQYFRAGP